ncbi:hypothetical protein HY439_00505 [Candidatus Microgenomates bacterium]|nr:hypothetical protein [Candidatus Microgenomates bacterium]
MVEENPQSPQELAAREDYRAAFLRAMASRGLTKEATTSILQAHCFPVLEAECDEDDGEINLPDTLETALFAPYGGIRTPEGDPKPVFVRNVSLCLNEGRIDIEPKLINYTSAPKTEDFVTIAEEDGFGKAVSSTILFDFEKGRYYFEVAKINKSGGFTGDTDIEEHELTPDVVTGLTSFLVDLNNRQFSKVSIYKNPPDDPESPLKLTLSEI